VNLQVWEAFSMLVTCSGRPGW